MKRQNCSQLSARSLAGWMVIAVAAVSTLSCNSVSPAPDSQNQTLDVNSSGPGLLINEMHGDNITLRQILRFAYKDHSGSLNAVVEKTCDSLVVVGLGPFDNRLFSVRQTDQGIDYEPKQRNGWAFAPERILRDIRRSYFFPLQSPPPSDGVHHTEVAGMHVSELWKSGRLLQRDITGPAASKLEHVVITYPDGFDHKGVPGRIEVRDELRDYHLEVDTFSSMSSACRE